MGEASTVPFMTVFESTHGHFFLLFFRSKPLSPAYSQGENYTPPTEWNSIKEFVDTA